LYGVLVCHETCLRVKVIVFTDCFVLLIFCLCNWFLVY